MEKEFIMTLIGQDRPGLVEALAGVVADHGGNWLESRMCHLGGQFAGILRVQVASAQQPALEQALKDLGEHGLTVTAHPESGPIDAQPAIATPLALLEIIGQDRPGIVRQISTVLARENINVEELHTERSSAPMSGETLFQARIHLRIPPTCDAARLRAQLEKIGGDMQIDVALKESP